MSTRREQILSAIKTTLQSVSSPTNLATRIERSLKVALSREEVPCVVVEPLRDDPADDTYNRLVWSLRVRVSVIVRGTPPDQVADGIINSIHTAIMADTTLGLGNDFVMDILPGAVNFDLVDSDGGGGIFPIDYVVQYQTARTSMTTL